jgi:hypothetical protein
VSRWSFKTLLEFVSSFAIVSDSGMRQLAQTARGRPAALVSGGDSGFPSGGVMMDLAR